MVNIEFDENKRKLKVVHSVKIEEKICNFLKSAIKGDIEDVDELINRETKTREEMEELLIVFIIQINKSSKNFLRLVFEVSELNEDFSFVIIEKTNNVKIKHTT